MRISDWSSDVCSSDLGAAPIMQGRCAQPVVRAPTPWQARPKWGPWRQDQACGIDRAEKPPSTSFDFAQERLASPAKDRKSVVEGKSVSGRVDLGGRSIITKNKTNYNNIITHNT